MKFRILFVLLLMMFSKSIFSQNPFITRWNLDAEQIKFPLSGNYQYSLVEIANPSNVLSGIGTDQLLLTVPSPGIYRLIILPDGAVNRFHRFHSAGFENNFANNFMYPKKLLAIEQWGDVEWSTMSAAFQYCENMVLEATDVPDLSRVTSIGSMFVNCYSMNTNINSWDVSNVTDFSFVFQNAISFNQPLNNWNMSNAISLSYMFEGAEQFNGNLSGWNLTNVRDVTSMFSKAINFNQDINDWQFGNYDPALQNDIIFYSMFGGAESFNKPLNNWNVTRGGNFAYMFYEAKSFNQPLNSWKFSKEIDELTFYAMFTNAESFNQSLGSWDIGDVQTLRHMFDNSGMDCEHMSSTLLGWYNNTDPNDMPHYETVIYSLEYSESIKDIVEAFETEYNWIFEVSTEIPSAQCIPSPLPIKLLSFEAYKSLDNSSILKWKLGEQTNNKGFKILHSVDGINWQNIGWVSAYDNLEYSFVHKSPSLGINLYKFIQEDFDGTESISPIVKLQFENSNEVSVYPNPTKDVVYISNLRGKNWFELYDITGKVIMSFESNDNAISIDFSDYLSSNFVLKIRSEDNIIKIFKLLKQN